MPSMPKVFRSLSAPTRREVDRQRGSARQRGYDSRWDKASAEHRRRNPLCEYGQAGAFGDVHTAAADVTDHLFPHRGDRALFWQSGWWVSCCAACHNGPKQAAERQGLAALNRLAALLGRDAHP